MNLPGEVKNIQGRIVKGIGGFYYVSDQDGRVHECKARGKFRKEKMTPMVGDIVEFVELEGYSLIEQILPRRNFLLRPAVANVDSMLLVISAGKPAPDLFLCDKLLIQAGCAGIKPVVVINKSDENTAGIDRLANQYCGYYDTFVVSARTGAGIEALKKMISGLCVCFAGQSAVGKSSIINAIDPDFEQETGGLSKKTDRGKHTTRQAELLYVPAIHGYVVDTPGFSMYEIEGMQKNEISAHYPELQKFAGNCRFTSCLHDREPDCAVKDAVEAGEINKERYDRYLRIIHSLKER